MKQIFLTLLLLSFSITANAQVELNVTKGVVEPLKIAVSLFYAGSSEFSQMADSMPRIIADNLDRSGLFVPINPAAFVQKPDSVNAEGVKFPEWRATSAQFLVTGKVLKTANGQPRVEFRLWDVVSEKQLTGTAFTTTPDNWRRIAHIISDTVYERITGESGYFDSRIVYVSETGPVQKRIKRLAIMDQDGANHKYLTNGNNLVLTPRFSPTEQKITYLEFGRQGAKVYLYNLANGQRENIGSFKGMTFAPRFSPDGRKLIMSMASGILNSGGMDKSI